MQEIGDCTDESGEEIWCDMVWKCKEGEVEEDENDRAGMLG